MEVEDIVRNAKMLAAGTRRKAISIITALFIAASGAAFSTVPVSAASQDQNAAYNVILSVTGNAASSMTVTWHDKAGGTSQKVIYGTSASLTRANSVAASKTQIKSEIPLNDSIYSAQITGLTPGTTYYYCVDNGKKRTDVKTFTTAQRAGGSSASGGASFVYMGDIQVSRDAESEFSLWGKSAKNVYKLNPDVQFGILGGDIVDSGVSEKQFGYFLNNASEVFSYIPMFSTNGNHESNFSESGKPELYLDMFTLPQNGPDGFKEEIYSFDYENCHITVLNSWIFSGEQKVTDADLKRVNDWIEKDLSSSTADVSIVVMHHPAYALASDNVSAKVYDSWRPLFENNGVDLVLCGHQHVYARSYPLTAGRIDVENGVTYVMGVSGQKFYSSADETKQERVEYGRANCQIVRTSGKQITLTTVDADGNEIDYWTTTAREKPGASCVSAPGGSGSSSDPAEKISENAWSRPFTLISSFIIGTSLAR